MVGVQETDLGLGLVVEGYFDSKGQLAPTLSTLLKKERFTNKHLEKLRVFLDNITESELIVGDLNSRNIIFATLPDQDGKFVLIDGLGDKTFLPMQKWFARLKKRNKKKYAEKLFCLKMIIIDPVI